MCRITELVSDVLINLCHIMDFGSDGQIVLINLECMFSTGISMWFISPLNSFLCVCEVLKHSSWQQNDVKVVLPYLVEILLFISMLPTPLNNQLGQNQPTSVLIFLSVYKGNCTGQPCASAPTVTGSSGITAAAGDPHTPPSCHPSLPHPCPQPPMLHKEGWANPKEEEFPTPLTLL